MLTHIAQQFFPSIGSIAPLGNGYINDTYKVETDGKPFVLQRINTKVFPHPEQIMANLQVLCRHADSHVNPKNNLKIPQLYRTHTCEITYQDDGGDVWRAWEYIDNTDCYETLTSPDQARAVGKAMGQFHRLLGSLNPNDLHDTLPGFHIAPQYFAHYQQVKSTTNIAEDGECAGFIKQYQSILNDLENAKALGLLQIRVIHGDPKLNNFLFDKTSGQIVSLIDLDTVKPGLIHYDIGDCLRSCCHNLETDGFNLNLCQIILTNYLGEMKGLLTDSDYRFLYPCIRLIPFELGLRFYSDYLEGNRYFKVNQPEDNLRRAIGQFNLCASVIAQEIEIENIINKLRFQ